MSDPTTLYSVLEDTCTHTGLDFLHSLTRSIALRLAVDYAFVGELARGDPGRIRTLSFCSKGEIGCNFEYPLSGTPCEKVFGKSARTYADDVQQLFPEDRLLREKNIVAFAGVPLFGSDGMPLGLLVLMSTRPIRDIEGLGPLLSMFSARVSAEVERDRTAAAAEAAREILIDAIESLPDAFVVFDQHDRLVMCNEKLLQYYPRSAPAIKAGNSFEEIIRYGIEHGEYAGAFDSPERREAWVAERLAMHRQPKQYQLEKQLACGRWLRIVETRMRNGGMVGFRIDITDLKNTENELRETNRRLEEAQRIAHLGYWNWDITSDRLEWSNEVYRIFGLDRHEFAPNYQAFMACIHPDDVVKVQQAVDSSFQGMPYSIEHRIILPDQTMRHVHERGEVVRDEEGRAQQMVGTVHDITEMKEADHALRLSEERFSLAMRGANDGVWDWNLKTNEAYFSPRWCSMLGYQPDELEPTYDSWIRLVDPDDKDRVLEEAQNYIDGKTTHLETEFRMRHKDGSWIDILSRAYLTHHNGDPARLVGTHVDMTERKRNEAELIQHRDHLEQLVARRTQELQHALEQEKEYNLLQQKLVSLVSHEFRTPLSIIDSTAQRLARHKQTAAAGEIEARTDAIRATVRRLINLMESILYAARLDAGKISFNPAPGDLKQLLLTICAQQNEVASAHRIELDIDALPDQMIMDERLLDLVFSNLISNAVKYSPRQQIICVRGEMRGAHAAISVIDQGIGIDAEDLPHIFKRFFRARTAEGYRGSGIGLNTSKEFVDMHGGWIDVASTVGHGTIFTVHLPLAMAKSSSALSA